MASTTFGYSQNFAPTGASWYYSYTEMGDTGFYQIQSVGDTTILGQQSKIIDVPESGKFSGFAYVYSNADSVFMYSELTNSFQLLYAYDAQVGDSWTILRGDVNSSNIVDTLIITVDSIYLQNINSNSLRSLDVTYLLKPSFLNPSNNWNDNSTIVEIIGDFGYLFNFPKVPTVIDGGPYPKGLRCYSDNSFGSYETGIVDSCTHYGVYVGIEAIKLFDSKIWPNPVNEILNIEITPGSLSEVEVIFELYDMMGKRVLIKNLAPFENTIDVSHLTNGVYTYKMGSTWGQIIKQ